MFVESYLVREPCSGCCGLRILTRKRGGATPTENHIMDFFRNMSDIVV